MSNKVILTASERKHLAQIAQTTVDCHNNFVSQVMAHGFTKEEAEKVFSVYLELKIIKIDRVNKTYNVTHGAYWGKEVFRNAINNY